MSASTSPALKILMLHGFTQSGPLFHAKSRALEKVLQKAFPATTLHYLSAPIALHPSDIPGYTPPADAPDPAAAEPEAFAWWRAKDGPPPRRYEGLETGLERIAECIRAEGPFDGVIGFSQGGAAAAMVASLLEDGRQEAWDKLCARDERKLAFPRSFRAAPQGGSSSSSSIQPPLKFAIVYSGFRAPDEIYGGFYDPKIRTPVKYFLGSLDTVVEEERGRALMDVCVDGQEGVIVHPGGHFVPSQKVWLDAAVGFVRECCLGTRGKEEKKKVEEEGVEDMDVPF